jgi:hypothetical protein
MEAAKAQNLAVEPQEKKVAISTQRQHEKIGIRVIWKARA